MVNKFGVYTTSHTNLNHPHITIKCTIHHHHWLYWIHLPWNNPQMWLHIKLYQYIYTGLYQAHPHPIPGHSITHVPPFPVYMHPDTLWYPNTIHQSDQYSNPPPPDATIIYTIYDFIGILLYCTHVFGSTIHVCLGTIWSQQNKTTKNTANIWWELLHYLRVHPNITVYFVTSNMMMYIHHMAPHTTPVHL